MSPGLLMYSQYRPQSLELQNLFDLAIVIFFFNLLTFCFPSLLLMLLFKTKSCPNCHRFLFVLFMDDLCDLLVPILPSNTPVIFTQYCACKKVTLNHIDYE